MENCSKKKILVIGSYNVGLSCQTNRIPVWGETITVDNFTESNGGKGSNQAVAASRLGGKVSFIGCIGNDGFGNDGVSMLKEEKVDISGVIRSNTHTGVGFIFLNEEGENCIMVAPGANNDLKPVDVVTTIQFDESDFVIFQLENDIETVKSLMVQAKEKKKKIIFNPAPASVEAISLLEYADIVNPNETELLTLNNRNINTSLSTEECIDLAQNLLTKGPESIIVTRGEQGALLVTKDFTKEIPAKNVTAIDTTGAGDSFTGALSVALSEGHTIEKAVEFANKVAAFSVTKQNVIPGLPTLEDLNDF
ncbi:ribokinase [Virgibacillus doumboii]|uniref:ribokinase n=1 Tax=Virgibacillus doumboii TaxID=2697503 RepID=UPI0013E02E8C|nr:ribokinase [Virgibacillus doumboii]